MKSLSASAGLLALISMSLSNLTRADEQFDLAEVLKNFTQADGRQLLKTQNPELTNGVGFLASFVMTRSHRFDPAQGREIRNSSMAWTNGCYVTRTLISYEHPPIFRKAGILDYRPLDYDREGHLIVWRAVEEYSVYAPERNDSLIKYLMYHVNPEGRILDTNAYTILTRYAAQDPNSLALFEQFRMATGRGFARHLQRLTSARAADASSDRIALEAVGSYGPGLGGTWTLSFEKKSGTLVREAAFVAEGSAQPIVQIMNAGQVSCPGLIIAESSSFASGWYRGRFQNEGQYQILSLRCIVVPSEFDSFYREILGQLDTPLPEGRSETIDRRGSVTKRTPTGEKPAP